MHASSQHARSRSNQPTVRTVCSFRSFNCSSTVRVYRTYDESIVSDRNCAWLWPEVESAVAIRRALCLKTRQRIVPSLAHVVRCIVALFPPRVGAERRDVRTRLSVRGDRIACVTEKKRVHVGAIDGKNDIFLHFRRNSLDRIPARTLLHVSRGGTIGGRERHDDIRLRGLPKDIPWSRTK